MEIFKKGAVELMPGEEQKIADAWNALKKDAHAPRQISVTVRLHVHNEYPKHLHKQVDGKNSSVIANSADEENRYAEDGYGDRFTPEPSAE